MTCEEKVLGFIIVAIGLTPWVTMMIIAMSKG
jgi:hypothetical protein